MSINTPKAARNPDDVDEIINIEDEIYSIRTSKAKAKPAGDFEITLAPTNNWVSRITVGSWVAILASTSIITQAEKKSADRKSLKMIGRVDSVRISTSVEQGTGNRISYYVISGRDWAGIFDNILYIDQMYSTTAAGINLATWTNIFKMKTPSGEATDMGSSLFVSTSKAVKHIVKFMGSLSSPEIIKEIKLIPTKSMIIPTAVRDFLRKTTKPMYADNINIVTGVLDGYDKYKDVDDSLTLISGQHLVGQNTWWSILQNFANPILNELVTELSWDSPGSTDIGKGSNLSFPLAGNAPKLTLFKRIKPFVISNDVNLSKSMISSYSTNRNLISRFTDLATFNIPAADVIAVNAGTNWESRINFIEVMPYAGMDNVTAATAPVNKLNSQVLDDESVKREGLKPMILSSQWYGPKSGGTTSMFKAVGDWKDILKEWYFNTHNMLNGTVSIVGQDDYIQVGGNVRIPIETIDPSGTTYNESEYASTAAGRAAYLLAHIEGLSHEISRAAGGAVTFYTHINFVRGILVDEDNNPISQTNPNPTATDNLVDDNTKLNSIETDKKHKHVILQKRDK